MSTTQTADRAIRPGNLPSLRRGCGEAAVPAQDEQEDGRDDDKRRRDEVPHRAAVGAGGDAVQDGQAPEGDDPAMRLLPGARAELLADVEARAEREDAERGDLAEAGRHWPVGQRERDQHARDARLQPRVEDERDAVDEDGDDRGQRRGLVDGAQDGRPAAAADRARAEQQARADGDRREHERRDAGRACREPHRAERCGGAHRAQSSTTLRSSRTSTPPWGRWRAAASGPARSAAFARTSASRAVGASAVACRIPVQAGSPRAGSTRWWATRPPVSQERRVTPLVATAPVPSTSSSATWPSSTGSATRTRRVSGRAPPRRRSPAQSTAT